MLIVVGFLSKPGDLFRCVLIYTEQGIRFSWKEATCVFFWVLGEPRADILPADMAVGVDFDQAAKSRFAKEGVTIGQALRGAHERSVERFL